MTESSRRFTPAPVPAFAALAFAVLVAAHPAAAQAPRLGETTFPNSGAAGAQPPFINGVLWLHSFEYARASEAFREAQRIDPDFALAYWGEAMTYNHPVWFEQDAEAARAVLHRLAPTPEARRARAPTEREKLYMDAVETLYGPGEKASRDTAYAEAMRILHEAYADDENAAAFYALALLGTSHGGRDIPTYMRAAAIVEDVFANNPKHPGAAHYLIHSYDDPVHAPLGLRAARAYAGIAPDAAHAQHMTTHIFVAVGMWDRVVSQNEIAAGPDRDRWTPNHYTSWLLYGYLQQGRHRRALEHLEALRREIPPNAPRFLMGLVRMRADYVINAEAWSSPVLDWNIEAPANFFAIRSNDLFVRGWSALRRGDRAGADRVLAALAEEHERLRAAPDPNDPADRVTEILHHELQALIRLADGSGDDAVALLRDATAIEDAMPFEFGPPPVVKPSHELLGDVLLELGRAPDAQAAFERALRLTPGRTLALRGLGRAAAAAGDRSTAARAYASLRETWHAADPGIPGLQEALKFVSVRNCYGPGRLAVASSEHGRGDPG